MAQVIVTNSGCANACTGPQGMADAREMAVLAANRIGCAPAQALVASTGVIGVNLKMDAIRAGIPAAFAALSRDGHADAAQRHHDDRSVSQVVRRRGRDAGAARSASAAWQRAPGMIEPRMATMLGYLTTDADVEPALLRRALVEASRYTFNAITVDGESSTNDCVFAHGQRRQRRRHRRRALRRAVRGLPRRRARTGARHRARRRGRDQADRDHRQRRRARRTRRGRRRASIANSPLVKTAIHGGDPNWGRLVAAAGRSGVTFSLDGAMVRIGPLVLFSDGQPHDELAPRGGGVPAEARRSRSKSTSAPAAADAPRSTPATCRPSTSRSTRSIGHESRGLIVTAVNRCDRGRQGLSHGRIDAGARPTIPELRCKDFLSILDFNHEELGQSDRARDRV